MTDLTPGNPGDTIEWNEPRLSASAKTETCELNVKKTKSSDFSWVVTHKRNGTLAHGGSGEHPDFETAKKCAEAVARVLEERMAIEIAAAESK